MNSPTIRQIQIRCAALCGVTVESLWSRDKHLPVVNARYAAILISFEATGHFEGKQKRDGFRAVMADAFCRCEQAIYYARTKAQAWRKTDKQFRFLVERAKEPAQ